MAWMKDHEYIANWIALAVAVLTYVGPSIRKVFGVITETGFFKKLAAVLSSVPLLIVGLLIELTVLMLLYLSQGSYECLVFYASTVAVLLAQILEKLDKTTRRPLPDTASRGRLSGVE